jgi:hypothetical protein
MQYVREGRLTDYEMRGKWRWAQKRVPWFILLRRGVFFFLERVIVEGRGGGI